jgi:anti-sigma regulatory factor (Ser/Thr protein kinase)
MFDNNPGLTAADSFAADFRAVSGALQFSRDFLGKVQCGPDAEAKLLIVIEELVANLIEHGDSPDDSEIGLELAALGADIGITLTDAGTPFDPRSVSAPVEPPPERGGGAGLALIAAWATIVSYDRVDGRNVLRLVLCNHG